MTINEKIDKYVLAQGNQVGSGAELAGILKEMVEEMPGPPGPQGPQGPQGNTGSSVDYPFELVNNLTTDDPEKGLSAAQGVVLKGEISQLGQEVDDLTDGAEVDSLELTETSGKYITGQGTIASSVPFAYTEKFYVEAGKEIIVTAAGENTNVVMIAKVITEDSAYSPLVMSTDSFVHSYKYIVAETGYFAASYNKTKARKVQISINTPELLDKRIDDIEAELPQLAEQVGENKLNLLGASATVLSPSVTSNKFITGIGTVVSANGFAYTEKFYVEKGQLITVHGAGYATNVAIISKVITENSQYTLLVLSEDSTVRDYTYLVQESGYYAASYYELASNTIIVSNNTPSALSQKIEANDVKLSVKLSEQETRLLSVERKTTGASISILTLSETSNKFITGIGTVVSANGFAYTEKFYVEKGQLITVHGAGYATNVAIISKVNTEGSSYSARVMSIDSSVHDYAYIADSSGYYAASYAMSGSHFVAISANTPLLLSERIDEVSSRLDIPNLNNDLFCGIPKVGIIGDSLSSGAGYNPNTHTTEDNIQYAWWKALERKSGMTYKRFCQGGMSTRNFITNMTYGLPTALTEGNECNLYIIALAVNDRDSLGPSYLGSTSDIDMEDPDNNEDTFYGNYAKIIQKITAFNSGCKFMLFTDPRTEDDFNVAIRTLAGLFDNCYLVDLSSLYSTYFMTGGFYKQYEDGTAHYPAMAYQSMANIFEAAMNNCINTNYSAFKQIQYQG